MKISISCGECFHDKEERLEMMDMEPIGVRATNIETQSQSQTYKCKNCKKEIILFLQREDNG